MKKVLILLIVSMLGGCYLYRAPFPYNNECKAWVGDVDHNKYWGMTPAQAMEKMPDPQDRFNYYICVNSYMHPLTQKSDIFFPDAEQSAKVVGKNLVSLTKLNEIFLAIHVLADMHKAKKYDVLSDVQMMSAILDSKKKVHTARQRKEIDETIRWMESNPFK